MKILHTVESYYPSIGGMQEVVQQISQRLVKMGHEVTIATSQHPSRTNKLINGVKIVEFQISGKNVTGIVGEIESYKDFLLSSDFDIITNFAAQQWATDLMLPLLDKIKAKKVFVPTGFSSLYDPEYHQYFENMKKWMKQYDMNVFLSEIYRDIEFAKNIGIHKITVIPNGAAEDEFYPGPDLNIRKELEIPENQFIILLVGSHTRLKGHIEAIRIFRRSYLKKSTLIVVGNSYDKWCYFSCILSKYLFNINPFNIANNRHIIIVQLPRHATVALYKTANLFLFPSNVECSPLVLFECMAAKLPFLTTDVGNAREIITWSDGGVLLPTIIDSKGYSHADIKKSVSSLENLAKNSGMRKDLGKNGFENWQKRFSWEIIAKEYERLYQDLMNGDKI
jgi:glycosyltransferase involved in cell wall biosynthesis